MKKKTIKKPKDTLTPKLLELFREQYKSSKVKQHYTVYELCLLFKESKDNINKSLGKLRGRCSKLGFRFYSESRKLGYTVAKTKEQKKAMHDRSVKRIIGLMSKQMIPIEDEADLDIDLLPALKTLITYETKYIKTTPESISGKKNVQRRLNKGAGK